MLIQRPLTRNLSADLSPAPTATTMSVSQDVLDQDIKGKDDSGSIEQEGSEAPLQPPTRPPIIYSSPKAFANSVAARWRSVWTRPFIMAFLAGQVVSLCITCTNVTTTELVNRGWTLSTTQGFFLYVLYLVQCPNSYKLNIRYFTLFVVYTPYTIYQCMVYLNEITVSMLKSHSRRIQRLVECYSP